MQTSIIWIILIPFFFKVHKRFYKHWTSSVVFVILLLGLFQHYNTIIVEEKHMAKECEGLLVGVLVEDIVLE